MRNSSWILLGFLLLVLQTTSLGLFRGSLYFDLPLIFIYCLALLRGPWQGLLCGVVLGLLMDMASPLVFGFYTLTRGLCGLGVGSVKEMIFKNNHTYHVLLMGGISLLSRLLYLIPTAYRAGSTAAIIPAYALDTLCYCLGNMILVLPVLKCAIRVERWIREEDPQY